MGFMNLNTMENMEQIEKNLIMIDSMVKIMMASNSDARLNIATGALQAIEQMTNEVRLAAKDIRRQALVINDYERPSRLHLQQPSSAPSSS